jgi:hypothetical protein
VSFPDLVRSFVDFTTEDPLQSVYLGVLGPHDRLPDPTLEAQADRASRGRDLLARVRGYSGELTFDETLDRDLMALELESDVSRLTRTLNGRLESTQLPKAAEEIGDPAFLMFINDPREAGERLSDITARLEATPEYLDGLLARLDTPVQRWVDIDVERVEGLPSLFANLRSWADHEGWADAPRLEAACRTAEDGLKSYVERLRALPTTTQLHLNREQAQEIVRLRGIDMSLPELHTLATDYLARLDRELEELRGELVAEHNLEESMSTAALAEHLDAHYAVKVPEGDMDAILRRYEVEHRRILDFIAERDLFPILDDQDLRLMRTPTFMEPSIPAGAMMPPPPLRPGRRTSLVYLTLKPELLAEHTELGIPGMMIHEGIPGHHLQLATAAANPSPVRGLYDGAHHAEGWTTMLEDYMLDLGYMGDLTAAARFSGKRDIARIGARVAIDLFFMTGEKEFLDVGIDCDLSSDDPFVAAGNLLAAVTGFVPERVQAELNWNSQERGYPLSYLTGNHLVWKLKAELADANRGRLEGLELDRAFHRTYLESGNMPVRWLWRVFQHAGLLPTAPALG